MPVYSMTGYASLQKCPDLPAIEENSTPSPAPSAALWRIGLEIRSVNSRFLDLTLKLAEEFRPFESSLRELLQKHLRRGKVELRASLERQDGSHDMPSAPSIPVLQRLACAEDTIRTWLPQAGRLTVADVLRLASQPQSSPPVTDLQPALLEAAQELVGKLQQARQTEGAQLADSLLQRVTQLRTLAQQAAPLIPQLVEQQRQRFLEKWNEALKLAGNLPAPPEAASERALTEATAFAIRIDVAEELTRLQSHLDTIENLLHKGGELGKRLDFLIQELHREANTLGSKSASLDTSRISVDMKVLIEQMREQVQNIE